MNVHCIHVFKVRRKVKYNLEIDALQIKNAGKGKKDNAESKVL